MHSIEKFDTYLTDEGYWILLHTDAGKTVCSNKISDIVSDLGMKLETLTSLLGNTEEGLWPVLLGGKTFRLSSLEISPECRILSLRPVGSSEIADMLTSITGDEIFVLISPQGRILSMSGEAVSLFDSGDDLASLFDSWSSGAIQAAVQNCLREGSTQDFLVSHSSSGSNRSNYSLSMRKLPSPGRLVFCRLTIPSVAVVTSVTDRKSLVAILLEESFCPALIINSEGVITSMNGAAKDVCQQMWGMNPTGSSLYKFVHPKHRKIIEQRHEQRNKGYTTTSRFSVKLQPSMSGSEFSIDVSIVPLPDTDQYVIFARTESRRSADEKRSSSEPVSQELMKLLSEEDMTQTEIVEIAARFLGATSAAFAHEGEVLTIGDSRELMQMLDPIQLAASPCGFRKDGIFLHRIHSGFGISHLVFQGIREHPLEPLSLAVLHGASRVLAERKARSALKAGHRILTTVKALANSFLKKTEPLDGLLSDLAKDCRAETAVVFKINPNGTALKGIGAAGVVGILPDLPIEALNTASWACIRGETAFFAETPEDDLRFSPVFLNSRSELAVPYFSGNTTDGVILLASTETEAFHYVETEMIQMMAILFSAPERSGRNESEQEFSPESNALKQKTLEYIVHNITALCSASGMRIESLEKTAGDCDEVQRDMKYLADLVTKLDFFSRWTLWWLKISVYGGSPDHRWIDPVPLLEKVLNEFKRVSDPKGIKLSFHPPKNDIEVCTDGSFVSMIAYSLLVCIMDYCDDCENVGLTVDQREDHWSFRFDTAGGSVSGECLSVDRQPKEKNMAFTLAWKLTEELGGTVSTFSSKGKTTRMIIRLKVSG